MYEGLFNLVTPPSDSRISSYCAESKLQMLKNKCKRFSRGQSRNRQLTPTSNPKNSCLQARQMPTLTLAPLVHQQRRGFSVSRFDPRREESSLVSLIPQVLIQIGICNLFQGFNIVNRNQVTVEVHELNTHLIKRRHQAGLH